MKVFSEPLSQAEAKGAVQVVIGETTLLIPLIGAVDVKVEKDRIQKELSKIISEIEGIKKKLSNKDFMSRAPQDIVDTQQKRLENALFSSQKLEQALERLND